VYEGDFLDGEKNGQGSENKQIEFFVLFFLFDLKKLWLFIFEFRQILD